MLLSQRRKVQQAFHEWVQRLRASQCLEKKLACNCSLAILQDLHRAHALLHDLGKDSYRALPLDEDFLSVLHVAIDGIK